MSRGTRVVLGLAGIVWGLAWIVFVSATLTKRSPARTVRFVGSGGQPIPSPDRPYCHGAALVDGARVWQICDAHPSALTRFDLSAGVAEARWPLPGGKSGRLHGAARSPQGELFLALLPPALLKVSPEGGVEQVGPGGYLAGMAWVGDHLELVPRFSKAIIQSLEGGQWVERRYPPPPPSTVDRHTMLSRAWHDGTRWHLIYQQYDLQGAGPGPLEITLLERLVPAPPGAAGLETLQTLTPTLSLASRDGSGQAMVQQPLLAGPPGGLLAFNVLGAMPYELEGGRWVRSELPLPEGLAPNKVSVSYDARFTATGGLEAIPVTDLFLKQARVGGIWYRLSDDQQPSLERLDPGGASAQIGPALVHRFWLEPGFKLLPAEDGGLWAMGGLGETGLHVDTATLARTDGLSFGERIGRLLQEDRAKRNAGFYDSLAALKKAALPFGLLLWPLALGLALLYERRRPNPARPHRPLHVAAWTYLIGALVLGWWFWRICWVYW